MNLERLPNWLVVHFERPHAITSWALVGGGDRVATAVAWLKVRNADLPVEVDAKALLRERLSTRGLDGAVGLLTSGDLGAAVDVTCGQARCIATVGLSNALRVGDPPGLGEVAGTINLLVVVAEPLSREARLEALALAAEARTAAVLAHSVPSFRSQLPATGTGTDCIVIASPAADRGAPFCGKHTQLGHDIGAAVFAAVDRGTRTWLAR
jgi:adenosylcobinamide amidohydrolase